MRRAPGAIRVVPRAVRHYDHTPRPDAPQRPAAGLSSNRPEKVTMNRSPWKLARSLAAAALVGAAATTTLATAATPAFPADSTMAKIQKRGEVVIGVKFDVPMFGQKNPLTGQLQGYEIDIANQLGRDLFGSDG